MEFLEMLATRKAPEDHIRVSLVTVPDDGEVSRQREQLDSIVTAFDGTGIEFSWSYDGTGTLHGRDIVTDNGWKIVLDTGTGHLSVLCVKRYLRPRQSIAGVSSR